MKLYTKIKRPDNASRRDKHFIKGEDVCIQEKIDGSNVCIWNDNGLIRIFSRREELNKDSSFMGFPQYIDGVKDKLLDNIPLGTVLYGEWLGSGKIGYNGKASQNIIPRLYIFDSAWKIDIAKEDDNGELTREWNTIEKTKEIAMLCGFNFVPILEDLYIFNEYKDIKEKYVDNQISKLDNESFREGVVIKSIDGEKRLKIVSDKFKEVVSSSSNKKIKGELDFIDKYITPARVIKFITRLKEDGLVPQDITLDDYKNVFKNISSIADDIIEEEIDNIIKDLKRIIRKQSTDAVKMYLEGDIDNE